MNLRVAVIASDAPVSEDALAAGLCHVNTRLFKALNSALSIVFVSNARLCDIDPELRGKSVVINSPFIFKVFRKVLTSLFGRRMQNVGFRLILPQLVSQLRKSGANWIFCPCGLNPFDLERAFLLAKASKLPLAVYLVDDFLSGNILLGHKERLQAARNDVAEWIRGVDKVFVISDGFRMRIKELYGKDSIVLPLPYNVKEKQSATSVVREEQIIFVGHLSHFYIDGLRLLAAFLDDLNSQRERPVMLRLTLPHLDLARKMVGNFKCIQCASCDGLDALHHEIGRSLLAFVPYSFDLKYRVMTQTSFPSKLLLCLAAASNVLVYGPEDSTAARYFCEHDLQTVFCKDDPAAFRDLAARLIMERKDHNERYRAVLQAVHASDKVADKIVSNLRIS